MRETLLLSNQKCFDCGEEIQSGEYAWVNSFEDAVYCDNCKIHIDNMYCTCKPHGQTPNETFCNQCHLVRNIPTTFTSYTANPILPVDDSNWFQKLIRLILRIK